MKGGSSRTATTPDGAHPAGGTRAATGHAGAWSARTRGGAVRNPRLLAFAVVAFVAIFGAGEFARWVLEAWRGVGWWGIDLRLVLDAAGRAGAHQPIYADPKFLYPPLAAIVATPLRAIDFDIVGVGYAAAKVAIAIAAVRAVTAGWDAGGRVLAVVGVVGSLPFVHDVMLGNANVLLVAAIVPAAFGRSRARNGILLGLAAAVFAKPLLVPVALWLLVFRRPVLAGAAAAGLSATVIGVIATGPGAYLEWIGALIGGSRFAGPFEGNHGVTALVPELWLPIALLTTAGLLWVLARRDSSIGFVWAVTSGILIAPYAGTYGALPIALALPAFAAFAPMTGLAIVAVSPIATTHPLPVYAAAIMLAARGWRDRRREAASGPAPSPAASLVSAGEPA